MEKLNREVNTFIIQSTRIAEVLVHLGNSLASQLHNIGRDSGANWIYTRIYPLQKRLAELEPEHHKENLAEVCCGYGRVLRSLRQYEEADALFVYALEIYIKKLKFSRNVSQVYRERVAAACNEMGMLRNNLGEYEEAENMFKFARIILKYLTQECPDTYDYELGDVYLNSGLNAFYGMQNMQRAKALFQAAYNLIAKDPKHQAKADELSRLVGICSSKTQTKNTV